MMESVVFVDVIDETNYEMYIGRDVVVRDSVNLSNLGLTELPNINFISVVRDFDCSYNHLTSLKGAPNEVGGVFDCSYNKLKNLEYSPSTVGSFYCYYNALDSLEGCPTDVRYNFYCFRCGLKSLKGCPRVINGDFVCRTNSLMTLKYAPEYIGGDLIISFNLLTSLKDIPKHIGGFIHCTANTLDMIDCPLENVGRGIIYKNPSPTFKTKINLFNERLKKFRAFKELE